MKKILILLIVIALCLPFVSCEQSEKGSAERIPLTLETDCVYSQSDKDVLSKKIISVIEKALEKKGGEPLSPETIISINETIENELFVSLESAPVYPDELNKILDAADRALDSNSLSELCSVYTQGTSVLGAERNGYLCFELLKLFLNSYNAELLPILTDDIGKSAFSDVCGVFGFIASIGTGIIPAESSFINAPELLMILKRQSEYYLELDIEDSTWSAAAKLFGEALPINEDNMYLSVISALSDGGAFEAAAASIPAFLEFYSEIINSMTASELELIISNSSYTLETLCAVLSRSENKFKEFTLYLEENASVDLSVGYDELKTLGYEQKYLDYIDNMKHSRPHDLFDAIKAYSESPSISAYGELNTSAILYVYHLSPALAFALEHKLAEVK